MVVSDLGWGSVGLSRSGTPQKLPPSDNRSRRQTYSYRAWLSSRQPTGPHAFRLNSAGAPAAIASVAEHFNVWIWTPPGDVSTVPFASATVLVPASLGLREPDRPLVAPNVSLASGQAGCLFPASLPRHLSWPEARTTRPRAPAAGDSATWCGPFAPATLLVPARLGLRDRPAPARRLPPLRRPDSVRFRPRHSTPPPATPISSDHVQLDGSSRRGGSAAFRSAS